MFLKINKGEVAIAVSQIQYIWLNTLPRSIGVMMADGKAFVCKGEDIEVVLKAVGIDSV
jgi:hypothetical protein